MAKLLRDGCCEAIDKLKEFLGTEDVLSALCGYLDSDTLSDFIEDTAKDYDLEDEFPEIFAEGE